MKKLVVLAVTFFIGITNVLGVSIEINDGKNIYEREYQENLFNGRLMMELGLSEDYELTHELEINNLILICNNECANDLQRASVQIKVWEYLYPSYEFKLFDKKIEVDWRKNIENLKIFELDYMPKKENNLKDKTFEVNIYEKLKLHSDIILANYEINGYGYSLQNYEIEFQALDKIGLHEIEFKNKYTYINNYMLAFRYLTEDFKIYVNVIGEKVNFIINDLEDYFFRFNVYEDDKYIKTITISPINLEFYFKENTSIILKDITDDQVYETLPDIVINKSDTITLFPKKKKANVLFKGVILNYSDNDIRDENKLNITIMDNKFNVIDSCEDVLECNKTLEYGNYYIYDNLNKVYIPFEVYEEKTIEVIDYYVNGFISNKKIESIKRDNNEINFTYENNIYYLDDFLIKDVYEFIIDGKSYNIDLNDSSKYVYIKNELLLYNIEIKEEIKEPSTLDKPNEETPNIKNEGDIEISIPNTGIDIKEIIYDNKKKYYLNFTNISI